MEAILDGAAQVFARRGYAGATTNHIAARAGLAVGSLYQYFPSKDAILVALVRRHMREGTELLGSLLGEAPAEPPGGALHPLLRRFVDAMVALHAHDPVLHRVLFEEAPHPREVLDELRRIEDAAAAAVELLLRGHPEVRVPDPSAAAWMVVQIVEALTHRHVLHAGPVRSADAFAAELTALLGAYLTSRPQDGRSRSVRAP